MAVFIIETNSLHIGSISAFKVCTVFIPNAKMLPKKKKSAALWLPAHLKHALI